MTCLLPSGRIASTCIALPRRWKCGWKFSMSVFSFSTVKPSVIAIEFGGMSSILRAIDAGEADQVAALLRLLALRVEPDADFRAAGDFLADRVDVLVPRDLLARHEQLAGARTEQVVALADRPLHQLRAAVDQIVGTAAAIGTVRGAGVDGVGIVVQHEVGDRVVDDLARLQVGRTNLDHLHPARLGERDVATSAGTRRPGARPASCTRTT